MLYIYYLTQSLWKSSVIVVQSLVLSDSLRLHGLQNARLPCPSPSPGANYVRCASDAIQPSRPLSSPSLPAFNLSQHQSLLQWGGSSYQVAKVLELQLQHQSFSEYWGLISFRTNWFDLLAEALSRVFNTTIQKHQFFRTQSSLWTNIHIHTWLLEKLQFWLDRSLWAK